MEILIVAIIILFLLIYTNMVDTKTFIAENDIYLKGLKEKDYDFYVSAKYGDKVDPNQLFSKRLRTTFYGIVAITILFINNLNFINFIAIIVVSFFIYKSQYLSLKNHYKRYMHEIDQMLPYYLKSLEILCQNYTVPVAISKSIDDAPDIFKPGLKDMIARIDAGDSTIKPYMDFAIKYPVRDSMRMMRLLYRLGLGEQEKKHKQLLSFSKSVSSLQEKSREEKYKSRLGKMESMTMTMLLCTGGFGLLLMLVAMVMMLINAAGGAV